MSLLPLARLARRRSVHVIVFLASLPACGPSSRDAAPEEVTVTMSEFDFGSSRTRFIAGTPYRFVLRNTGAVAHEWAVVPRDAVNDEQVLTEVEEDDLTPGTTVIAEFTFPRAGEYDFACFVPGHFEAGMKLPVTVTES